jgi:flagellar biogenesis protein FliO
MFPFEERRKKWDEEYKRTKRAMKIWAAVNVTIVLGLIAFGIWVIVKVMAYFGVI